MIRKTLMIATASLGLVVATPVLASQASELVSQMADAMQFMVGPQEGSDMVVTSIKAEGETLVLRVDGPKGWRQDKSADELSDRFMSGFCEEGSQMFETGMKIRIESTEEKGQNLMVGPNEDSCPD